MATNANELYILALFGVERLLVDVFSDKSDRRLTRESNPATLQFIGPTVYLLCPCKLNIKRLVRLKKTPEHRGIKWILTCQISHVNPADYNEQMRALMSDSTKTLYELTVKSVGL